MQILRDLEARLWDVSHLIEFIERVKDMQVVSYK